MFRVLESRSAAELRISRAFVPGYAGRESMTNSNHKGLGG